MIFSATYQKKPYVILWVCCLIGSLAVIPYIQFLGILPPALSFVKLVILGTFQAAVLYGVICYLSYKLVPKTDLQPFAVKSIPRQIIYPGILYGCIASFAIFALDKTIFSSSLLATDAIHPPRWTGALASLYGSINEEVLLRLFLFTLIYFIFRKISKATKRRLLLLWMTNILVAIVFGLGHLPAAFKLTSPSSFEISRVLLLNGIPSILFGYLYWSQGLFTAMTAHFVADLILHVVSV